MSKPKCMHCASSAAVRECPDQSTFDQTAYYCDRCKRPFPVATTFGQVRPVLTVGLSILGALGGALIGLDHLGGDS